MFFWGILIESNERRQNIISIPESELIGFNLRTSFIFDKILHKRHLIEQRKDRQGEEVHPIGMLIIFCPQNSTNKRSIM